MILSTFNPRIIEPRDWATLLFVLTLLIIAIAKVVFESRFNDFLRLIVSDKYIKIYRDSSHLYSGFNIAVFIIHLISLSFLIQLTLSFFGYASKTDWLLFIQIITFLSVFILSKFLIEKIIATTFNMEEFVEQFNLQKVSYRTYITLLIFPIDVVLFYNNFLSKEIFYTLIVVLLATNALTYVILLKNYQNLLLGKLFYFILYLCALEIAPYYFMYYWFTKNSVL